MLGLATRPVRSCDCPVKRWESRSVDHGIGQWTTRLLRTPFMRSYRVIQQWNGPVSISPSQTNEERIQDQLFLVSGTWLIDLKKGHDTNVSGVWRKELTEPG
ncbi:hypothetical protein GBAR_LOCUS30796 [Geodia barretti]|uniref:Uncharacterized protein n=1 Tax=Geodia barretti TaxID=519541 RepID=A0AA35TZ50_GEOBA|nr:hypothetical protein GBAR_LOCUS30796 [Geodia barretti]